MCTQREQLDAHSSEEQSWCIREVCRAMELNCFWGLRTNTIHLSVYSCKHSALISEGLLVPLKNLFSQHHWEKGFHGFNFGISRHLSHRAAAFHSAPVYGYCQKITRRDKWTRECPKNSIPFLCISVSRALRTLSVCNCFRFGLSHPR